MVFNIKNKVPKFVKSAIQYSEYPIIKNDSGKILPEIAIVGRSNVGKSTLLNDLFQLKIAKTSSTPGKTQLLNFFNVEKQISFVDLPGYGFAKVPIEVRKKWGPMVQEYLNKREALQLVLFLFDIRRVPNEEDIQLMEWIAKAEKGVILVLTKVDKVNQQEKMNQTKAILEAFDVQNIHYVHYSAPKQIGREHLLNMIQDAFKEEA